MAVEVSSNMPRVKNEVDFQAQLMTRLMIEDVHNFSTPVTPKKEGNLRIAVSKQVIGKKGIIEWKQPHANVQERGYSDEGRVFRHYTTPGTGPHYAEESVKKVMSNIPEYLMKVGVV